MRSSISSSEPHRLSPTCPALAAPAILLLAGALLLASNWPVVRLLAGVRTEAAPPSFPLPYARLLKPAIVATGRWEGVYLGGSRMEQNLRPSVHDPGHRVYNAAISGPSIHELVRYGRHAIYSGVRELTVSTPFIVFLRGQVEVSRTDLHLLRRSPRDWRPMLAYARLAFQRYEMVRGRPVALIAESRWNRGRRVDSEGVDDQRVGGRPCGTSTQEHHAATLDSYERHHAEVRGEARRRIDASLAEFATLLDEAHAAGVPVTLLLLPAHDALAARRVMDGVQGEYLYWLSAMRELALQRGVAAFRGFDPLPGITDEPFAVDPETAELTLTQWRDPAHACGAVGARLRARTDSPGDLAATDLLDKRSFDAYVAGVHARYARLGGHCRSNRDLFDNCFRR